MDNDLAKEIIARLAFEGDGINELWYITDDIPSEMSNEQFEKAINHACKKYDCNAFDLAKKALCNYDTEDDSTHYDIDDVGLLLNTIKNQLTRIIDMKANN